MKGFERFTVSTLKLSIVFFVAWVCYVTVLVLQSCFEMLCALVVIFNFRLCFLFLIFCSTCDRVLIWNEGLMCHGMLGIYKWSAYDKNRGSWNKLLVSHKNCTREKTAKFSQFAYKVQVGRISDAYLARHNCALLKWLRLCAFSNSFAKLTKRVFVDGNRVINH